MRVCQWKVRTYYFRVHWIICKAELSQSLKVRNFWSKEQFQYTVNISRFHVLIESIMHKVALRFNFLHLNSFLPLSWTTQAQLYEDIFWLAVCNLSLTRCTIILPQGMKLVQRRKSTTTENLRGVSLFSQICFNFQSLYFIFYPLMLCKSQYFCKKHLIVIAYTLR